MLKDQLGSWGQSPRRATHFISQLYYVDTTRVSQRVAVLYSQNPFHVNRFCKRSSNRDSEQQRVYVVTTVQQKKEKREELSHAGCGARIIRTGMTVNIRTAI